MKSRLKNIVSKVFFVYILMLLVACQNQSINNDGISFVYSTNESDGITEVGMQNDSVRNGLWIEYYPNKIIKAIQFYVNGELQGPFLLFYENGNLKFESQMMDNEFEGERTVYYDNGKIQNTGHFINGLQDGIWKFYTYNGDLDKKIQFEKGEVVDTLIDNELIAPPPPLSPLELN